MQSGVRVEDTEVSRIQKGLLVLLGVEQGDTRQDAEYLADKIVNLRVFEDDEGKMNLSVKDIGGQLLVVSQFTLCGDCKKAAVPAFPQQLRRKPQKPFTRSSATLHQSRVPVKRCVSGSYGG